MSDKRWAAVLRKFLKKELKNATGYCPGPVRQPYFLDMAADETNPEWLSAGGDFCVHGCQYPHPLYKGMK